MANERIAQGRAALYVVAPDLLDHLRAAYRKDAHVPYPQLFEQVRSAPFLIIDDVDAANLTDWASEKIFQLANFRLSAGLPTVLLVSREPQGVIRQLIELLGNADVVVRREITAPRKPGAADDDHRYREIGGMSHDRLRRHTFDGFRLHGRLSDKEAQNLELVRSMVLRWAQAPSGWLVLMGPTGTGKTHLACATGADRLEAGDSVFFAVVPDLLDYLRRTYRPDNPETYDEVFDALRSAGLLILDDLGAHSTTPWAEEKLYQLLSYRYVQTAPTIITTNIKPDDLDPRLASRIFDHQISQAYELDARDYRTGAAPRPVGPRSHKPGRRPLRLGQAPLVTPHRFACGAGRASPFVLSERSESKETDGRESPYSPSDAPSSDAASASDSGAPRASGLRCQAALDPVLPVRPDLLLPDRHDLLQPVDRVMAGLDALFAVRRRHRDQHTRLADPQAAPAGDAGATAHTSHRSLTSLRDLPHDLRRHRRVHVRTPGSPPGDRDCCCAPPR